MKKLGKGEVLLRMEDQEHTVPVLQYPAFCHLAHGQHQTNKLRTQYERNNRDQKPITQRRDRRDTKNSHSRIHDPPLIHRPLQLQNICQLHLGLRTPPRLPSLHIRPHCNIPSPCPPIELSWSEMVSPAVDHNP
jgi:hypothetical protein